MGEWNYGHDVVLYLTPEAIAPVSMKQQAALAERLKDDLVQCAKGVSNEFINEVRIELEDEEDFLFQTGSPLTGQPPINPDAVSFWKPGQIRLFISHRDKYKAQAQRLASSLEKYGIFCFVAHDTIEPMESWQHEIEKGLQTMEFLLALITEDFHESVWTNQEVGYAKGKGVPVISLKVGKKDPEGFVADKQALKGDLENLGDSASAIYRVLAEKLHQKDRLQTALISSFVETPNWGEATTRFKQLDDAVVKLSDEEFDRIKLGYETNDQLYNAAYLHYSNRFQKFIRRTTGKEITLEKGKIVLAKKEVEDEEIPF